MMALSPRRVTPLAARLCILASIALVGCSVRASRGAPNADAAGATPRLATGTPTSALGSISCPPATGANDYRTCSYQSTDNGQLTFYLYVPRAYDPQQRYPLVLLLHGGGERANPGNSAAWNRQILLSQQYAAVWGPGFPQGSGQSVQSRWPSFVVVPQLTYPHHWVSVSPHASSYSLAPQPTPALAGAMDILTLVQREFKGIDPNRRYITGLSIGGFGTWDAIERWPAYFAAAAPVSGAGDPTQAGVLVHLPVWAFHGGSDPIVPIAGSRLMIQAITAAGGHPCFTEYPGMGHVIWPQVYAVPTPNQPGSGLFAWMFAQHRGEPATPGSCSA